MHQEPWRAPQRAEERIRPKPSRQAERGSVWPLFPPLRLPRRRTLRPRRARPHSRAGRPARRQTAARHPGRTARDLLQGCRDHAPGRRVLPSRAARLPAAAEPRQTCIAAYGRPRAPSTAGSGLLRGRRPDPGAGCPHTPRTGRLNSTRDRCPESSGEAVVDEGLGDDRQRGRSPGVDPGRAVIRSRVGAMRRSRV